MRSNGYFKLRRILLTICDVLIVMLAYSAALILRYEYGFSSFIPYLNHMNIILPVVVIIHLLFFIIFQINRSLWQFVSVDEALRIVLAIIISNVCVYFYFQIENHYILRYSVLIIATVFIIAGMLGIRIVYRYLRLQKKAMFKSEKAIIIGAGVAGSILHSEIRNNSNYNTKVVGYIDDASYKKGSSINGYRILGTTDELVKLKSKYKFTLAFIAIPSASKSELKSILNKCQKANLKTKLMNISEVSDKISKIRDVNIDDLLGRGEVELDNLTINDYLAGRVVLITGAGGSIGSELCRQIIKFNPKQMIMLDNYENNLYNLQMEFEMLKRTEMSYNDIDLKYIITSITEEKAIKRIFNEYHPNVVYHAAAHKHVPLMESVPREAIFNNVYGTYNVINACIAAKVTKFILISSDKAVNPTNVMGATKRMVELMVQAMKDNGVTTLTAVRFGNVLNSNGSVIPLFKKQIETTGVITITDPKIQRYFMTIPEAAQLVLQAGVYAKNGEIFVLDMGKPVLILDLAINLIKLSGLKPYEDIKIEFIGLRPGEKMYEELAYDLNKFHKTKNNLIYIADPENVDNETYINAVKKLIANLDKTVNINDELLKFIAEDFSGAKNDLSKS